MRFDLEGSKNKEGNHYNSYSDGLVTAIQYEMLWNLLREASWNSLVLVSFLTKAPLLSALVASHQAYIPLCIYLSIQYGGMSPSTLPHTAHPSITHLHRPVMDGSQQIVAALTNLYRNAVTSISNNICVPWESAEHTLTDTCANTVLVRFLLSYAQL